MRGEEGELCCRVIRVYVYSVLLMKKRFSRILVIRELGGDSA